VLSDCVFFFFLNESPEVNMAKCEKTIGGYLGFCSSTILHSSTYVNYLAIKKKYT
jgi:hypothetical protein